MLRSMTGFGQAARSAGGCRIQVDMKSVNHRYCEIMVRMPREWLHLEDMVKKRIQRSVQRGRIDVFIALDKDASVPAEVSVDWALAEGYRQALEQLRSVFSITEPVSLRDLLAIPDLLKPGDVGEDVKEEIGLAVEACTDEALAELVRMREAEGAHLRADLQERLRQFAGLRERIAGIAPLVAADYRDKLAQRMRELLPASVELDEARVAQEAALFADRSDITEELTRLQSHLNQCASLMETDDAVGRKLDFLVQEMNREINTIGSKANHAELAAAAVDWKAGLEKFREQVQNIE